MDRVRRRTRRGLLLLGRAALGGAATAAGAGAMAGCAGVGQSGGQGAPSAAAPETIEWFNAGEGPDEGRDGWWRASGSATRG